MTVNTEIPKGTIVFFTSGEYSDYGISGHFITIDDLSKEDFIEARETVSVQKNVAEQKEEYSYFNEHEAFINRMILTGKMVAVTTYEMHIGSYGKLEFDI